MTDSGRPPGGPEYQLPSQAILVLPTAAGNAFELSPAEMMPRLLLRPAAGLLLPVVPEPVVSVVSVEDWLGAGAEAEEDGACGTGRAILSSGLAVGSAELETGGEPPSLDVSEGVRVECGDSRGDETRETAPFVGSGDAAESEEPPPTVTVVTEFEVTVTVFGPHSPDATLCLSSAAGEVGVASAAATSSAPDVLVT